MKKLERIEDADGETVVTDVGWNILVDYITDLEKRHEEALRKLAERLNTGTITGTLQDEINSILTRE